MSRESGKNHPAPLPVRDRGAWLLFAAGVLMYAVMRLYRMEDFPVYFFTDEAVHMVQFQSLVANGWHSTEMPKEFLPAYFVNGGMFNLSLSVYLQGVIGVIFGQTIETVRATSAIISLSGAFALAMVLRTRFRIREWWISAPILAVLPCWFLHSRTGFETVMMVSAYSWFVYFYLRYRANEPQWVFAAMLAGAAVFYAYAPGQGVMFISGLLLLVIDADYHWKNRRWFLTGAGFALVLFLPYLRFRWLHPQMVSGHLATLESYWVQSIPVSEKLLIFFKNYVASISPDYWFSVGADKASRHIVPGNAHFPLWLAPLAVVGAVVGVSRWREPACRMLLVAFVATPFSSALVGPMVTRLLAVTVPFALCTALGFSWLVRRLEDRRWLAALRAAVLALLMCAGAMLMRDALMKPAEENTDYGLYGLQWGAQNIFRDLIPPYLQKESAANIIITHTTFNSPEVFPEFFGWKAQRRVTFSSLADIEAGETLPEPKDLVLLSSAEFLHLQNLQQVSAITTRETISLPNGKPGFYLVQISLKEEFVAEIRKARGYNTRPLFDRALLNGIPVSLAMSGVERGRAGDLARRGGQGISSKPGEPINLQIFFDEPVGFRSVEVRSPGGKISRISIWGFNEKEPVEVEIGRWGESIVTMETNGKKIDWLRVEVTGPDGRVNVLSDVVLVEETGATKSHE